MEIIKKACAGTLESSDTYVEIEPAKGLSVKIDSVVMERFGETITKTVYGELSALGIENAAVSVSDRGALDCVIRARIETAVKRAGEEK